VDAEQKAREVVRAWSDSPDSGFHVDPDHAINILIAAVAQAIREARAEALSLYELREANETRQREWDRDERITLAYRGNELAGEVGEACNVVKKLERERLGIRGSRATLQQLSDELADVVICVDLVAMAAGVDLAAAVVAKFNATSEKNGLVTRLAAKGHP
jgi:NTP pyrophosphatase (non-canonical NTP hydrolase)